MQKLYSISKNIISRQHPLELVFEDNLICSLLKELDIGKKDVASDFVKIAPRPPGPLHYSQKWIK